MLTSQTIFMHYPMDGNADDISGNNYNGTLNGPTLTTNQYGQPNSAYLFDGVNDYIDIGMISPMNNILSSFTVSFWMKTSNVGVSTYYEAMGNINTPGAGLAFTIDIHRTVFTSFDLNSICFYLRDNSSNTLAFTFNESAVFDNNWHCIVFKINNSATGSVEVYIDGNIHNHTLDFNEGPLFSSTDFEFPFVIGALNNRGTIERFFDGSLDQFKIYDYAVNNTTILSDCSTSLKEVESIEFINGVQLYPNPADQVLHINNQNEALKLMTVFDIHGKIVIQSKIQNIDVSAFSQGVYLIVFEDEQRTLKKQYKFIKE